MECIISESHLSIAALRNLSLQIMLFIVTDSQSLAPVQERNLLYKKCLANSVFCFLGYYCIQVPVPNNANEKLKSIFCCLTWLSSLLSNLCLYLHQ